MSLFTFSQDEDEDPEFDEPIYETGKITLLIRIISERTISIVGKAPASHANPMYWIVGAGFESANLQY